MVFAFVGIFSPVARMHLQRLGRCAIHHQPFFCLNPIQNLSYIEAATFLSIEEVLPEVHFELTFKLQGRA